MKTRNASSTSVVSTQPQIRTEAPALPRRPRLETIDLLRGVVMVLMALDHSRDFFSNAGFSPTNLAQTTPALFLTRWITHFCAPVFMLLAGMGAYLSLRRGKTRKELSWYLLTRGAWLIVLELTVVHVAWGFQSTFDAFPVQVIWALGWSMIVLAGLVFLPSRVVLALGVMMVLGHNLLDGLSVGGDGAAALLWGILHQPGTYPLTGELRLLVIYPLIPWIGVMAAGYGLGELWTLDRPVRRKWLLGLGAGLVIAFVTLRWINGYGDPESWSMQKDGIFTLLSFLNTTKYPASLLYLLMTLGPALLLLAFFDRDLGPAAKPLVTIGRVPLFFYLIHLPAIKLVQTLLWLLGNTIQGRALIAGPLPRNDLWVVYVLWIVIVTALYPLCRWFATLKDRHSGWLRYL